MHQVPVYKAEREAGIAEQVRSNASVAYVAELSLAKSTADTMFDEDMMSKLVASLTVKASANELVLHKLDSILVSTGWNLNDDVFDRGEVWASRYTPEDTPLNYEHKCNDIIGHIVACKPVDIDYKIIAETSKEGVILAVDDLPEKYHIYTSAVLYKLWSDKTLQERMDKIIAEIPEHKWFVSMEALFANFDYALITPTGEHKIIARNEETAFLTKYLRAYKDETTGKYGVGHYKGNKIGRLVRNITFCGKGLVKRPGNPDSIIFASQPTIFLGKSLASHEQILDVSQSMGYRDIISGSNQPEKESVNMSVTVEQLQAKLDSANKQIDTLVADNANMKNETVDKLKAQVATLNTDIKSRDEQLSTNATELASANEQVETLKKEVAAKASELTKASEELAKVKAVELKTNRTSALVSIGLDKAEAEECVEMTSALSDEAFTKYVAKTKAAYDFKKKDEDEKEKKAKADEAAAVEAKTKADAEAAAKLTAGAAPSTNVLDNAQLSGQPALAGNSGVSDDKTEGLRNKLSAAYKEVKGQTKAEKK
jgi:hypothetical protein